MRDFYIYILQVNAGLAVFYLLYRILTAKDTFFEIRRFFLLSVLFLAFAYPLVPLAEWLKDKQPLQAMIVDYSEFIVQAVTIPKASPVEEKTLFTVENILSAIWLAGSAFLLFRFLVQLGAVIRLRLSGEACIIGDTRVIVLKNDTAPFSFFGWIFVDPCCYTEKELQGILIHEKTHARQGHSWDTLAGEILCIFFWYNPGVWLIRREIRQNLEFLADRGVLDAGYNRKDYQYHLLRLSNQSVATQIINNFNVSQLKKRIMMMNQKKASKMRLVKYVIMLPVTGLLILASNARTVAEVTQEIVGQVVSPERVVAGRVAPETGQWDIKGRVTDEQGERLPGVAVGVQDQGKAWKIVTTDAEGNYGIQVSGDFKELCFSYPGMAMQRETVKKGTSDLNVVMKPGAATVTNVQIETAVKADSVAGALALDEVVVVGLFTGEDKKKSTVIYSVVDEEPQFIGGEKEVGKFIAKNIKYPQYAAQHGIQGTVEVAFVIDKEGNVTGAKVMKGVDGTLDAEAIRVVESMPRWKPGEKSGKPVNVQLRMPISFNLLHETENGTEPLPVEETQAVTVSVRSSGMVQEAGREDVHVSLSTKTVKADTSVFYITTKGTNAPGHNVSFTVSSVEGESQSSLSPALYQAAVSQIDPDKQIVILNDKLVEDVKDLPQDLSGVAEIRLLRDETAVRKMNKKYGKNADNVLIIKSK